MYRRKHQKIYASNKNNRSFSESEKFGRFKFGNFNRKDIFTEFSHLLLSKTAAPVPLHARPIYG